MKKLVLAAVAALTLGMGAASARNLNDHGTDHLPSPAYSYSPGNG